MRDVERRAESVRAFNRFYTRHIGVLGEGHLGTAFSLTEVRVLHELANVDRPTAAAVADRLGLDRGYLSRMLRAFRKRGFLTGDRGTDDRREILLQLTPAGRTAFAALDDGARAAIVDMLEPLDAADQHGLLEAMTRIQSALGDPAPVPAPTAPAAYVLRAPRAGDLGWVVHRHGVLYAQEYGWDERFEALVAGVVAEFVQHFDARRERCWIAESDGEIVGSVFVVAKSRKTAKLRLLLVEPSARGMGLGHRLVDEVIQFARAAGYRKLALWTHPELEAARHIYAAAGFTLVDEKTHTLFGKPLVAETWTLELHAGSPVA